MGSICQDDEYEEISLSVTTQAFLNEFLLEKQAKLTSQDEEEMVTEDWQVYSLIPSRP
jgi:hypothetical protein